MTKGQSAETIATFGKMLNEFKTLTNKDLQLSFWKGAVWGFACLVLICIASWLVEVMRTRIFYSGSRITTYPQQLSDQTQPTRSVPYVQMDDNLHYS